jgi:hypothetical protein
MGEQKKGEGNSPIFPSPFFSLAIFSNQPFIQKFSKPSKK